MSQGTFSGLLTAILFIAFIVGVFWAYSSKRKAEFDAAARLPLDDGEPESRADSSEPASKANSKHETAP